MAKNPRAIASAERHGIPADLTRYPRTAMLVVGGGEVAARKSVLLLRAGARRATR